MGRWTALPSILLQTLSSGTGQRQIKIAAAKMCASERMADMYNLITDRGGRADDGHAYPIQLAYGLGKQCIGKANNRMLSEYDRDFNALYDELTGNRTRPTIDNLFSKKVENPAAHPLLGYNASHNTSVTRTRRRRAYANPVVQPVYNLSKVPNKKVIQGEWQLVPSYKPTGIGAGAGARASTTLNNNIKMNNMNNTMRNNNNEKAILSSSFAKHKGKRLGGARRKTRRLKSWPGQ